MCMRAHLLLWLELKKDTKYFTSPTVISVRPSTGAPSVSRTTMWRSVCLAALLLLPSTVHAGRNSERDNIPAPPSAP